MNQILCCDRQPERLRWSHLVHSGLPAVYHKKMAAVSCLGLSHHITSTSFPGLFPWRWAGRLAPPTFKGKALGARLKGLDIYQAILEEQTWSINHISCIFLHISIESAIFKTDLDGRPSPGRPRILRYKEGRKWTTTWPQSIFVTVKCPSKNAGLKLNILFMVGNKISKLPTLPSPTYLWLVDGTQVV